MLSGVFLIQVPPKVTPCTSMYLHIQLFTKTIDQCVIEKAWGRVHASLDLIGLTPERHLMVAPVGAALLARAAQIEMLLRFHLLHLL